MAIEISHLTIEGNHPGGTGGNTVADAINFFGKTKTQSGYSIHDCRIKNMSGRGVVLVRHCADVMIHHNIIENCSIGVFLFGGTSNGLVHDNVIRDCRIGGIFIDDATNKGTPEQDAFRPFYHSIHNNQVIHPGYDPLQTGFGIGVSASYGVAINNNIIDRAGEVGVIASPGIIINSGQDDLFIMENVVVSGNVVTNCAGAGIFLEAVRNYMVSGNILVNNNPSSPVVIRPHTVTKRESYNGAVYGNLVETV